MQDAVLHPPQAAPAHYEHFRLAPLTGALGAEIVGVSLANLSDAAFREIERAVAEHLVLAFRDQALEPVDQITFARRFGIVEPWPYARPMDGYPELTELVSEAGDINNFGGSWHTDSSTFAKPPAYTLLYCVTAPPVGGDTSFANQYLAWSTLPDDVRAALDGLRLEHSTARGFGDHSPLQGLHSRHVHACQRSAGTRRSREHSSRRTHSSGNGAQGALRQLRIFLELRGTDRVREPSPDECARGPRQHSGVHLPHSLAAGDTRYLG